jgi:hypothetical protein
MGVPLGLISAKSQPIGPINIPATIPIIGKRIDVNINNVKIEDLKARPAWVKLNHGYMSVGTRKVAVKVSAFIDTPFTKGACTIEVEVSASTDLSFGINKGEQILSSHLKNTQVQILKSDVSYSKGLAKWIVDIVEVAIRPLIKRMVSQKLQKVAEEQVPELVWYLIRPAFFIDAAEPLFRYAANSTFIGKPIVSPSGIYANLHANIRLETFNGKDYLLPE